MKKAIILLGLLPLLAAGCATTPALPPITPAPTASVTAKAETAAVGTANADAADDPAIWRNPANPAASLIVATDKKAGLHVYGLGGPSRFFAPAGRVNNVDLRDMGAAGIIVAASDRNDPLNAKLALYRLDPATAQLTELAKLPVGRGEAYGVCLYRDGASLHAFNVLKDGTIHQMALDLTAAAPTGRVVRTMKLATQSEGCVVDESSQRLYVGEEDVGVWRFDARATGATTPTQVIAADRSRLIADVEGMAIAPGGYLVVSSQGDHSYTVVRLSDDSYVGRFKVATGRFGATEETDGLEVAAGDFGADYPGGLMVIQDGHNQPNAQNFKLISWADVMAALQLQ